MSSVYLNFANNQDGYFIQKFFYIHNIDRKSEITAATTKGSDSWYSVQSTGTELVLEFCQVGCCSESCLLRDGSSCPNQAYASQWSVYNLITGKPLLDTAFRNQHWGNVISDSNIDSNANCNANLLLSRKMKLSQCSETEFDGRLWSEILSILELFQTYSELESYILSLYPEHTKAIKCTVQKFKKMRHTLELIAEKLKHTDVPKTHLSVITLGDGNCCAYSLNITGFGNDSKHIQIRTKIVIENVINK